MFLAIWLTQKNTLAWMRVPPANDAPPFATEFCLRRSEMLTVQRHAVRTTVAIHDEPTHINGTAADVYAATEEAA